MIYFALVETRLRIGGKVWGQSIHDTVLSLYACGITTCEIEEHVQEIYGVDVSAEFISRVTEAVRGDIVAWQSRPLEPLYTVVYMDGIRFNVRHENRIKKKVTIQHFLAELRDMGVSNLLRICQKERMTLTELDISGTLQRAKRRRSLLKAIG